ncbi:DUF1501 domain-containing protein [Planctomicrobium piriforme]|uniref:Tat (Twin-arginine translocation) pathway signal sequence n=1 Tax=Planctomicrobium piriforme TaxID=1576369 RepID=A0A1I3NR33_9PLAN|nr:DUF1501 domain-containing protein [Planctomicrobium piriforme]SFJ11768.1 Protein of unknown function [Planctomicrobium piriforme]
MTNSFSSPTDPALAQSFNRRWFLKDCGVGLGAIALAHLNAPRQAAAAPLPADPFLPRSGHFPGKAKNVIFLYMGGAPSQFELFDYKPDLAKFDGTLPPPELLKGYRAAFIDPNSKLLGPKFKFARHGESGTELSELLPHLSTIVDDITLVKSLTTDAFNHAPAQMLMSTGNQIFGRPSLGAWVTYGLGSESQDLPAFVVFSSGKKGPSGGYANWGSGFLPTVYQGIPFRGGSEPVLFLDSPAGIDRQLQSDSIEAIRTLNSHHLQQVGDPEIATRTRAYETAFRMQTSAPDLMDISQETQATLDLYGAEPGKSSFANNCLLARRLVERGVRFIELFHESWDQHGNLVADLKKNCTDTDQACTALIKDLKQRGLLEDTLVIWGGEFGRTPMVQGGNDGRDHHPNAFTMWFAGGGMKPGVSIGETDALGFNVTEDRVHVRDLHATLLHCLGLDHERLTYKFQGLDMKLTGVEPANIVSKMLA